VARETDPPPQLKSKTTPESAHKLQRQHQHQRGDEQVVCAWLTKFM
jgi:hypothetical protein